MTETRRLSQVEEWRDIHVKAVYLLREKDPRTAFVLKPLGSLGVVHYGIVISAGEDVPEATAAHDILSKRFNERPELDPFRNLTRWQYWRMMLGRDEAFSRSTVSQADWQQALELWAIPTQPEELEINAE